VTSTQDRSYYQTLDKPELIEVILQRDGAMLDIQEELKRIKRILNLRNKKLFGSASEKSSTLGLGVNRSAVIEDIEFEEVKPVGGNMPGKPVREKRYAKPHPGR
jgi:hypothetical protein